LIYRTDFVNGLDFRVYLEELVEGIRDLYDQPGVGVEVRVGTQNLQVGVDFSVDFGLIVNELVTNALKHGLLPAGGGVVAVEANLVEGSLVLTVRDPGPGYPQGASEGTSLGLGIVRSVLKKYGADLLFLVEGGSRVEVRVPWSGHRAAAT
ncbi:MAG TPA: sensor histidine kinase, partial [Spirochaetia bacterium]|nr:sensor histidine kinase [Spirochaetia bacterium]